MAGHSPWGYKELDPTEHACKVLVVKVGPDTRPPASGHTTRVYADERVCSDTHAFAQMHLPTWTAATLLAHSSPGKVSLAQNVCDKGIRRAEGLSAYTPVLALNPPGLSKLNTELLLLSSLGIGLR